VRPVGCDTPVTARRRRCLCGRPSRARVATEVQNLSDSRHNLYCLREHKKHLHESRTREHFHEIGNITCSWALLNHYIDKAIWDLAEVEQWAGACMTSQIPNTAGRLRTLLSLVEARQGSDGLRKALNQFMGDTVTLQNRRNRIAHNPWSVHTETGDVARLEVSTDRQLVIEWVITSSATAGPANISPAAKSAVTRRDCRVMIEQWPGSWPDSPYSSAREGRSAPWPAPLTRPIEADLSAGPRLSHRSYRQWRKVLLQAG